MPAAGQPVTHPLLKCRKNVLRKRAAQQVAGTPLVDFPDVTASTEPSSGALSLRQAGDLLAAEPTVLAGAQKGYARDSA